MQATADYFKQAQDCLERVVRAARPELLAAHGKTEPDIKSDNTPVTILDKQLEEKMRAALGEFDNSVAIVGEEFGGDADADTTHWLLDPIDGTENLVRGLPYMRNMATLIHGGEPVFAFVYKPVTDELFVASKGGGVTKNGQPVRVSDRPLSRAWIELSTPLKDEQTFRMIQAVRQQINGFRVMGDFTLIVEGKLEGQIVFKSGGGHWDYAPRALMIAEAGGRVQNIGSDGYAYRNHDLLMANAVIFDDLKTVINGQLN